MTAIIVILGLLVLWVSNWLVDKYYQELREGGWDE